MGVWGLNGHEGLDLTVCVKGSHEKALRRTGGGVSEGHLAAGRMHCKR